jgi:hypothetical protein
MILAALKGSEFGLDAVKEHCTHALRAKTSRIMSQNLNFRNQ